MAPKASPAKESVSQRDLEIILATFLSFKTPPQIDYDELAKNAGFKNAKTASTIWSGLKKKYTIGMNTPAGGLATPRKRKSAAPTDNGFDGSPAKKPKTPSQLPNDIEDDDEKAKLKEKLKMDEKDEKDDKDAIVLG
ncbi:hypothetical protein F5X99DRAFT_407270 [Biscogniauxia marginata]|nr:hypothetical protein F5X99DRAFT_407270 [Biscogniauxia marginata]